MNAGRRAFWCGRRVLLTGHTGFKGGWAALWLDALGAEVTGLALAPQTPQYDAFGPWPRLRSLHVDLRQRDALRQALAGQRFDLVLHFAAQSLVRRGVREPVATFAANVMGTLHLLEALSDAPPAVVLIATSDKVYRNDGGGPHAESDAFGGDDPYSASKAAAELAVHAWRGAVWSGIATKLATARAGNVIGGGDFAEDRLIPDAVRALIAGQPLTLRHPAATRPWQHVLDVLDGYFRYAERLAAGDALPPALNFGPSVEACLPVAEVIARLSRALGREIAAQEATPARSIEKQRLELDASAAQRLLGWTPRLSIDEALRWTAEGYRPWLAGGDARAIALAQIARYEALA